MSLQMLFLIFLLFSLRFSRGIQVQPQNQTTEAMPNITNRQSFYHYQYQPPQYQFQYQPINPPWHNWGNPQTIGPSASRPFGGQGSGPVQFPGPVNNKTLLNYNYNLYPFDNRTNTGNPNAGNSNRGNSNVVNTNTSPITPTTQNRRDKNKNATIGINVEERCKCGVIQKARTLERITGGVVSKDNAFPWMAAIVYIGSEAPFWFCGASLINDRYLITAAHCQKTMRRRGLRNIRILIGTNGIPAVASASELYEIDDLKIHPLYKPNIEEYDIGLIRLKDKMTFTDKISPICLTQRGTPFTDRMATVAGWGSIKYGDSPPDTLREVELKVVTNTDCQKEYLKSYGMRISSAMLCAWLPKKDSCQGDSGGPLFLKTTSSPQVYTQIGVVSFGPPQCGETTVPGVYTRISSTIRWVQSQTKDSSYCSGSF